MLDSPERVCAGQTRFEYPATSVLFSISRWKVASPPSLHGLRGTAGAVHRNTVWASQRAVARRGGPGGPAAGRAFVTLSVSSASVRRPVSGASDQCPRVPVQACLSRRPVSSVRCGRLSVQVSAVRCPVSGVRCPCVPASAVSGRSEVMQRGGGAGRRTAGMAGVGVVARCVHDRLVVCPSRSLALEAGAGCAGPAEVSVWTWPSSWEVVGQWPRRSRGRQYTPAREDRSSVKEPGAQRGSPPAAGCAARDTCTIAQSPPRIVHLP
jgi:hypothetical protein